MSSKGSDKSSDGLNLAICSSGELFGGIEQFIVNMACYIKERTSTNFIVVLLNKGPLYKKLKKADIDAYLISGHKYDIRVIGRLRRLFNEKKINVVHTHGYKANILCAAAARQSSIRVIKTEHGKIEPTSSGTLGRLKIRLNLLMDKTVSKHLLDHIVYVSSDIERHNKSAFSNLKNSVIYNGINKIITSRKRPADLDYETFRVGIVGRLTEVKGHEFLLKAFKFLKGIEKIHLYIIGEGYLEKTLKSYCLENGLEDRVHFLGFKDNVYDYIAALDILAMPSLHEGHPYTLLEAMYLKTPVIASDVGGLKEILKDGRDALLVPPADEERLAMAVKTLFLNPELREVLKEEAYRNVIEHFMIEKMAAEYFDIYIKN